MTDSQIDLSRGARRVGTIRLRCKRAFAPVRSAAVLALLCAGTSAEAFPEAQSTYRFNKAPEFLLLTLDQSGDLHGLTASWWDKKINNTVVGRVVGIGAIELTLYPASFDEQARREAYQAPVCRPSWLPGCFAHFIKTVQRIAKPVVASHVYRFGSNGRDEWSSEPAKTPNPYSSFAFYKDHQLRSLEERLRGGDQNRHNRAMAGRAFSPAENLVLYAVDELFGPHIVAVIAGVPGSQVQFNQRFCGEAGSALEGVLKKSGKWEVTVEPERSRRFRVVIKSHSDRERFYLPGVWWKAFLEIVFTEDDAQGRCSRAQVYLYDSVVCGAPASADPDLQHRQCFERIPPDSRAEMDFRDHVGRILVRAFGAPL